MDQRTAEEITILMCVEKSTMRAIKLLREHTAMNLGNAKEYLVTHSDDGTTNLKLYRQLCSDFVMSTEDLLIQARTDLKRAQQYVDQLEQQLALEKQ